MNFPILGTTESIPWDIIAPHESQAINNHGQTFQRLAERGGLDWVEAQAVIEDREFKSMNIVLARAAVLKRVSAFQKERIIMENNTELIISDFVAAVGENAIAHGWWDEERSFGDLVSLCHSELSEALEEFRTGHKPYETYYTCKAPKKKDGREDLRKCTGDCGYCEHGKPEGIPSELADTVIRIFDLCHHYGIDIEAAIIEKHEFNKSRPFRHGGKVM